MDLTPGTYPLGADATLNLIAGLVRALGGRVNFDSKELGFSDRDTLTYKTEGETHALSFVPAPTDDEVMKCLGALGIECDSATDEMRGLCVSLLKLKKGV